MEEYVQRILKNGTECFDDHFQLEDRIVTYSIVGTGWNCYYSVRYDVRHESNHYIPSCKWPVKLRAYVVGSTLISLYR